MRPLWSEEDQLGDALGRAHDVGGADGLVGGDQDEILDAVLGGRGSHVPGAEDIVLDRFEEAAPPSRARACRRRRGRRRRGGSWQRPRSAIGVLDAADFGMEGDAAGTTARISRSNFEERGFGDLEADDAGGLKARDLAAKFGADRSRGSGYEHDLVPERDANRVLFQMDRRAAEKVLDRHVADLASQAPPLDHLAQAGHGFGVDSRAAAQFEDARHLRAGGGGDGDQDVVDGVAGGDGGEVGAAAEDGNEPDAHADLGGVVVDEAADVIGQARVGADLPQQHVAGLAGSVDDHALALGLVLGAQGEVADDAGEDADADGGVGAEEEVQDVDGAGEAVGRKLEEDDGGGGERSGEVAEADANQIGHGDVAPPAAIELEEAEDNALDEDPDEDSRGQVGEFLGGHGELEAEEESEDAAEDEDGELDSPDEEPGRTPDREARLGCEGLGGA